MRFLSNFISLRLGTPVATLSALIVQISESHSVTDEEKWWKNKTVYDIKSISFRKVGDDMKHILARGCKVLKFNVTLLLLVFKINVGTFGITLEQAPISW